MKKTIICESILDNIEKSDRRPVRNRRLKPLPGEWQFCVMVRDATLLNRLRLQNILDVFAEGNRILHLKDYMDIADDIFDGGRLGKISEYVDIFDNPDAFIAEFNTQDLVSSVKCLFYMMIQTWTLIFFVEKDGKYVNNSDIDLACIKAQNLSITGKIKFDDYITLKLVIYRMLWPDETFDIEHANLLDVCMDIIKKKCERVADLNRKKYHHNL